VFFLFACQSVYSQKVLKIKGTVSDFLTSKPIAGTNVSVKGQPAISAETSNTGTFTLDAPSPYAVLIISYPGYQTKEFPLYGKKDVAIQIAAEGVDVGETNVRLPYNTVNEKDLNGAYTVIAPGYDKTIQY